LANKHKRIMEQNIVKTAPGTATRKDDR